jgi:hypothetical protein
MAHDKQALIHKRKKRYMAQILDDFEVNCEPHLPQDVADEFKGTIRGKLHAMALDTVDIMQLKPEENLNLHALDLRDRVQVPPRHMRSRA